MASKSSMKAAIASSTRGFICDTEGSVRFTRQQCQGAAPWARTVCRQSLTSAPDSAGCRSDSLQQLLWMCLSSFRLQNFYMTVNVASQMHVNASRSLMQPLLDCMLYLTQCVYDPGTLPSSANQCMICNLSRELQSTTNMKSKQFRPTQLSGRQSSTVVDR